MASGTRWRVTSYLIRTMMVFLALIGTLAIHYSTLQPDYLRSALAVAFVLLAGPVALILPIRRAIMIWGACMLVLAGWYLQDRPSGIRDWAPEYAIPATVTYSNGDVSVHHIRNFAYLSDTDFTARYYEATFSLDQLDRLDLVTSYWAGDAIAHVFLTFGFRDGRHLSFSIETRRRVKDGYSSLAGFFHHYELFYVVADERDVIGVRRDIRRERVYLYELHVSPLVRRELFRSYLAKVQSLALQPEWYNTLTDNCTTGILGRAHAGALEVAYNWRVLLSGYAAEYAYRLGLLNDQLSFAELQRKSRIVRPLDATIDANFSTDIRQGLP